MSEQQAAVAHYNAGKDAAARERAERLMAAKKKLKTYRARQSKNLSIASSSTASSAHTNGTAYDLSSPTRSASSRRDSGILSEQVSPSKHAHRRSVSKSALLGPAAGVAVMGAPASPVSGVKVGHLRQASRSRHSRGASINKSISKLQAATGSGGAGGKAHAHSRSRSRASMSMSVSSVADLAEQQQQQQQYDQPQRNSRILQTATPTGPNPFLARPPSLPSLGAPFTWGPPPAAAAPPQPASKPEAPPASRRTPSLSSARADSISSLPPGPPPQAAGGHQRRASRHNRQTSVSNFRESLEIVSGTGTYSGALSLQPATSSFAPSHPSPFMDVASPNLSRTASPLPVAWSNDPAKVLEALKERGRLEIDAPSSPEETRQSALEALEGKLSAPSEMIDLGNAAEGQLLVAPRSPGFTQAGQMAASSPLPPFQHQVPMQSPLPASSAAQSSPIVGLGMGPGGGVKRNSWSAPGPVTAQGAIGAMGLGSLAEEEEEEYEDDRRIVTPVQSPVRKASTRASPARSSTRSSPARSSPRKRPESLRLQSLQQSPLKPSSPAGSRADALVSPTRPSPSRVAVPPLPPMHSTIIPVMLEDDDEEAAAPKDPQIEQDARVRAPECELAADPTPSPPPPQPEFKAPRMRPLSLSMPGGQVVGSSSMSPSNSRTSSNMSPTNSRHSLAASLNDERAVSPVLGGSSFDSNKPNLSHFHAVAVATVNGDVQPPMYPSPASKSTPNRSGGLRSLSIGANVSPSTPSPATFPPLSGSASRRASYTSAVSPAPSPASSAVGPPPRASSSTSTPIKRSSIGYRNSSPAVSLASSAADNSASRRPWRASAGFGAATSPETPLSASAGASAPTSAARSSFPFAFGGFGELEQEATSPAAVESDPRGADLPFGLEQQPGEDAQGLKLEVVALKSQVEQLKSAATQLESSHALEMAEFEKKAGEEARAMKSRIAELEAQVEEGKIARRFEVEGLQREVQQAKEAIDDLTDERDSLKEDVDGWRERCLALEAEKRKDREEEALQQAQVKLIGEMRDQIYNLVAALEREKTELAASKAEVERLVSENTALLAHQPLPSQLEQHVVVEPVARDVSPPPPPRSSNAFLQQDRNASPRHRAFNLASDGSILSGSSASASFGRSYSGNTTEETTNTDVEDAYSSRMSPPSGHSSFSAVGSKGRESDFGASTLIQLQTLTEEEEEDEEARLRHASGSTGSTSSQEMPLTPNKDAAEMQHNRSHSFVRHWSFPKGSVSSVRISSDDDHRFFDLDRHASLPPLPFDAEFPPFVDADLTVEEEELVLFDPTAPASSGAPLHTRRPSSPRPADRMNPHARRFSGQYAARAPPLAPSALAHAQLTQNGGPASASVDQNNGAVRSTLARLSFGYFGGGWTPAAAEQVHGSPALPTPATAKRNGPAHMSISTRDFGAMDGQGDGGDRRDYSMPTTRNVYQQPAPPPPPPVSNRYSAQQQQQQHNVPPPPRASGAAPTSLYTNKPRGRYIMPDEVKKPKQSRLALLDFTPSCCSDRPVHVI